MKISPRKVAVFASLSVLLAIVAIYVAFHVSSNRVLVPARARIAESYAKHSPAFLADATAIERASPFPVAMGTHGAGPFLNPRMAWDGPPAAVEAYRAKVGQQESIGVPSAVFEALGRWGPQWVEHASDDSIAKIDTGLLKELLQYDHWDIESGSPSEEMRPFSVVSRPVPRFGTLVSLAKVRLLQAMRGGSMKDAAAEVRHVARLVHSTETIVGALVATLLLGIERAAFDKHVAAGGATDGLAPVTTELPARMQRFVYAYGAYAAPYAPSDVSSKLLGSGAPSFGKCAALSDGAEIALIVRQNLDREMADRYREIGGYLAANQGTCRLKTLRKLWAQFPGTEGILDVNLKDVCAVSSLAGATVPFCRVTSALAFLPGIRPKVGHLLLVGLSDPFRLYEK